MAAGTTTFDVPAGLAQGDVLFAHLGYEDDTTTPADFTYPAAFTKVSGQSVLSTTGKRLRAALAYHRIGTGTPPDTYDFGTPLDPPVGAGALYAIHGLDAALLATASKASNSGQGNAPSCPAVSTTRAGGAVLLVVSARANADVTWPAGAIEIYNESQSTVAPNHTVAAAILPRAAAGSTGALTAAMDKTSIWWMAAIALDVPANVALSGSVASAGHGASHITASLVSPHAVASAGHGATHLTAEVTDTPPQHDLEWLVTPPNPDTNPSPYFMARSSAPVDWRWQVDDGPILVGAHLQTIDQLPVPGIRPGAHKVTAWSVAGGALGQPLTYEWNVPQIITGTIPPRTQLGSDPYTVWAMDRRGQERHEILQGVTVEWHRLEDVASTAKVVVPSDIYPACVELLASLRDWADSIGLWRGDEKVWEGPLTDGDYTAGELNAADVSVYLGRRRLHQKHNDASVDACTVIQNYVRDAMDIDSPGYATIIVAPSGQLVTRSVPALTRMALSEIQEVQKLGVHMTTIRRQILIGRPTAAAAPVALLTDSAFTQPPHVPFNGNDLVTRAALIQQGSGTETVLASATDAASEADRGVHEQVITDTSDSGDTPQAEAQAALRPSVIGLSEGILSPQAPIDVSQLVPGSVFRLNLTQGAKPISGLYRLEQVNATAAAEQAEQVKVTFVAA